ncbi:enoyl-CoA hydratase/isomerase family protein [Salinirubrum litoreum]|uniref:Enoyl-CoA hydratase/isomerase family protein n=1 Tax=Salinirubrum litoreum TaxID=1126234 RepID=A0ABD5RD64_9EURY
MIRTETVGRLRVVTLDRPDRRNALRPADLDALEAAVTADSETAARGPVSVVYLHGAGSAFCAGADLDVVADLDDPASFAGHGQRVADAIESAEPVVVAGIDGPARGGGVELALACDLRIGSPDATFAEPGVQFGLFGAWGGTGRLREVCRTGDAMDLALSGRVIDADEARRIGLVSRVVDDPRSVAEAIATNEPDAVVALKRLLRHDGSKAEREAAEREAFADLVSAHADDIARGR